LGKSSESHRILEEVSLFYAERCWNADTLGFNFSGVSVSQFSKFLMEGEKEKKNDRDLWKLE
jgi:hypothetical protein